jgi:hypothetical protein
MPRRRLTELLSLANTIRRAAYPVKSHRLEVLARFSEAELGRFIENGEVDPVRLTEVAGQLGESPAIVQDSLNRFQREVLANYGEEHEHAKRCFNQDAGLKSRVIDYYENHVSARDFYFVLHGSLHLWEGEQGVLLQEEIEQDDDNDITPYAYEGYLVTQGLVFDSFIELLAFAFEKQWVGWEHLWAEDWLDRL